MIETAWRLILEICDEHSISPEVVLWADEYREHRQANQRAIVIRKMKVRGESVKAIHSVCKELTESAIRKILENGHQ